MGLTFNLLQDSQPRRTQHHVSERWECKLIKVRPTRLWLVRFRCLRAQPVGRPSTLRPLPFRRRSATPGVPDPAAQKGLFNQLRLFRDDVEQHERGTFRGPPVCLPRLHEFRAHVQIASEDGL